MDTVYYVLCMQEIITRCTEFNAQVPISSQGQELLNTNTVGEYIMFKICRCVNIITYIFFLNAFLLTV